MGSSNIHEWSRTSTWHGIPDCIGTRDGCLKIFWTGILTVATAIMIWQLYNVIENYIIYPKYVTSVTTTPQSSVEFPNITICNYNRANLTRKTELNISDEVLTYLYMGLPQNYKISTYDQNTTEQYRMAYDEWKKGYNGSLAIKDIFTLLGHDCEPTFLLCIFGEQE